MADVELLTAGLSCRESAYALLWRLFSREPDEGLVSLCASEAPGKVAALIAGEGSRACEHARTLRLEAQAAADQGGLQGLRDEFTRLFVGPSRPLAGPWESLYVGCGDQLFTEATLEVRGQYAAAGFRNAGYPQEPDDHLASELSFMLALCRRTMERASHDRQGCGADISRSKRFLEDHLAGWIGPFAMRVGEAQVRSGFYPAAALLASEVVSEDLKVLDELSREACDI